jgi:hypothetical protein
MQYLAPTLDSVDDGKTRSCGIGRDDHVSIFRSFEFYTLETSNASRVHTFTASLRTRFQERARPRTISHHRFLFGWTAACPHDRMKRNETSTRKAPHAVCGITSRLQSPVLQKTSLGTLQLSAFPGELAPRWTVKRWI